MMALSNNAEERGCDRHILELYVAGDNLSSRRAIDNLDEIVSRLASRPDDVVVVDVRRDPKAAFSRQIFATPSLVSIRAGRRILIVGDLSDRDAVVERLSL
ncbi:hypothetical protein GGR25_001964 [Kaistia hirudinis]|uniref:KaiB domain-containing protein n=1 Tax=Kaistia hirudinis TaxID=1293440 RepID=A0A840AR20_9HYPH|nr:circadian clock KaiB family protein [Kaistia hirudinis]MBB3930925.1 hypothetical protein [Kaistia hirudinis]